MYFEIYHWNYHCFLSLRLFEIDPRPGFSVLPCQEVFCPTAQYFLKILEHRPNFPHPWQLKSLCKLICYWNIEGFEHWVDRETIHDLGMKHKQSRPVSWNGQGIIDNGKGDCKKCWLDAKLSIKLRSHWKIYFLIITF